MFSAVLDTCVLVPSVLRDVLLEVAARGVYRPLWSSEICAELYRTLTTRLAERGQDPETTDSYIARLRHQMSVAFPDALVHDWQPLESAVVLPDVNDRHVVAAAIVGRADVIVTDNERDFPRAAMPGPLYAQTADVFLLDALDLYPSLVTTAVHNVARRTGRHGPERSGEAIAAILTERGCVQFGDALKVALEDV